MRVIIPDDWNGSEWACWRVWWPNSERWMSLLHGLLTSPTRGRWYDETTGNIKDAQQVGSDIFDRNIPLLPCCEEPEDETEQREQLAVAMIGAGITLLGGNDVGQVVTEIKIVNGKLRVYYGHCCYDDLALTTSEDGTGVEISQPEDGLISIPDSLPDFVSSSCAKACALVAMLADMVDIILDGITVLDNPIKVHNSLRDAYPNIAFGGLQVSLAYAAGLNVVGAGMSAETEDPNLYQDMRNTFAPLISSGNAGITSEEYEAIKSAQRGLLREYFSLDTYPLVFQSMNDIHTAVLASIGANDIRNATSYVVATGDEDCGVAEMFYLDAETSPDANGFYLSENLSEQVIISTPNTFEVRFATVAPRDVYGIAFHMQDGSCTTLNVKRMSWTEDNEPFQVSQSLFGNTSGQLQGEVNAGKMLINFSPSADASALVDVLGYTPFVDDGNPGDYTKWVNKGVLFGACWSFYVSTGTPVIDDLRLVYKYVAE